MMGAKMMWNWTGKIAHTVLKLGIALFAGVLATAAHAGTCTFAANNAYGNAPANLVAPLTVGALTIGRDIPDGTELYRTTIQSMYLSVSCSNTGSMTTITENLRLVTTPLPLANWNSGPYAGHVYQTGVPGIGIVFQMADTAALVPSSTPLPNCGSVGQPCNWGGSKFWLNVLLIKIGPVSPGVIQASNLPAFQVDWVTDSTLTIERISLTGAINIVAQTCTTPDVRVDMGQQQTKSFTGAGSATPWKDFEIQLQNCPAFFGRRTQFQLLDSSTGVRPVQQPLMLSNTLGFTLTPTTAIVNPTQGIVALSPTSSGPAAATGVGLQVANASSTPVTYNSVMASGIRPTATSGASYSIPLRARYIQTGSATPTPGPANTSMMFTINYQ